MASSAAQIADDLWHTHFQSAPRDVPQFRKRERDKRTAEVLRQKPAIEVADEDAVDVTRLSPAVCSAGSTASRTSCSIDGVELAEAGVAPADDVRLIRVCDPCDVFEMGESDLRLAVLGDAPPQRRQADTGRVKPPSTASTCPLMKLDSSPHKSRPRWPSPRSCRSVPAGSRRSSQCGSQRCARAWPSRFRPVRAR